jgi:pyrroloquinoline quinone (PQQ) biosynthesis protein C
MSTLFAHSAASTQAPSGALFAPSIDLGRNEEQSTDQPMPLDLRVERLLRAPGVETRPDEVARLQRVFDTELATLLQAGFGAGDKAALTQIQRVLYHLQVQAFAAPLAAAAQHPYQPLFAQTRYALEAAWAAQLEAVVGPSVDAALATGQTFEQVFIDFCRQHRLSRHPFFDFVEHRATRTDLRRFFLSDSAVVLRFFDLLVLSLVGADDSVRAELMENLWDEMGQRDPQARHNRLFLRLLRYVGISDAEGTAFVRDFHLHADAACLAGHNLYLMLGTQRGNHLRSLGCLGSAELMDAAQYAKIVRGCRRVGWDDGEGMAYYVSHAEADLAHGLGWLEKVLMPLVQKDPRAAREFLLGTAFRLETASQYYDSLFSEFEAARHDLQLVADGFGVEGLGDESADVELASQKYVLLGRPTGHHQKLHVGVD